MEISNSTTMQHYTCTLQQSDGSYSLIAYLTIEYEVDSNELYLLTKVSGHWIKSDRKIEVLKATLRYGCNSVTVGSQVKETLVENNFSIITNFTEAVPKNEFSNVGANILFELQYSTRPVFEFLIQNNCV